jgi:hypothetical protein
MLWNNHPTTPRCAREAARDRKVVEARKEKKAHFRLEPTRHINGGREPEQRKPRMILGRIRKSKTCSEVCCVQQPENRDGTGG